MILNYAGGQHVFGMLMGTPHSHLCHLAVIKEIISFGKREAASQVYEESRHSLKGPKYSCCPG